VKTSDLINGMMDFGLQLNGGLRNGGKNTRKPWSIN
jgi:hypothetical protein